MTERHVLLPSYLQERFRELREQRGWRLEDAAARARSVGLTWDWVVVSSIERGHHAISIEELLLLPSLFDLTLPELLDESDERQIAVFGVLATTTQLRRVFSGDGTLAAASDASPHDEIGLPEQKAAEKFGVEPEMLMRAAKHLWDGRGLAAERERRVHEALQIESDWNEVAEQEQLKTRIPARSLQARRGHMTRELLAELEPEIEKRKKRRRALRKEKKR